MKDKKHIIRKIKHCLALSKSANENESASALRQAHKMMAEYNIGMIDIKLADVTTSQTEQTIPKNPLNYQATLANTIAEKFGCEVYLDYDFESKKHTFCYVGIDLYSTIASYAFDVLNKQLKKARRDYIKTHLNRVRIAKNKYARADKFCLGWVHKVIKLVDVLNPPNIDKKLIESKMQALQLTNVKPKNRAKSAPKGNDFHNGWSKGNSATLHNAMSANQPTSLLEH